MKARVKFEGGFHNSPEINLFVNIDVRLLDDYRRGKIDAIKLIDESLTPYQRKRLDLHFCGDKNCSCDSWKEATIIL